MQCCRCIQRTPIRYLDSASKQPLIQPAFRQRAVTQEKCSADNLWLLRDEQSTRMHLVQAQMLTSAAMRAGFSGGLVIDYPHSTRAKKFFLVLMVGSSGAVPAAKGLDGSEPEADEVEVAGRQQSRKKRKRSMVSAVRFCRSLESFCC